MYFKCGLLDFQSLFCQFCNKHVGRGHSTALQLLQNNNIQQYKPSFSKICIFFPKCDLTNKNFDYLLKKKMKKKKFNYVFYIPNFVYLIS